MKINKTGYVLYINNMTGIASYAKKYSEFDRMTYSFTLGEIYDCSFRELITNLKILDKKGFLISKRK